MAENTEKLNYWFDGQLRRYTSQFLRVFQNFSYQTGRQKNGEPELRPIPVKHALTNSHVATILRQNSENVGLVVPMITGYIGDVQIARNRTQAPHHIDKEQIIERHFDVEQGVYTQEAGNRFSLERIMPTPIDLTLKADVWVSNMLQKDQIFEQLIVLFNPSLVLQHSDNPYDWTSMTNLELTDVAWSSRGVPVGTSDDVEIMSLTFKSEIWIQPPSWLHPQKLIHQIVTNIHDAENIEKIASEKGWDLDYSTSDLLSRVIITPGNHQIRVVDDEITLLGENGNDIDDNGEVYQWKPLMELYGKTRDNISQLRLRTNNQLDNSDDDIIGTFQFHPTEKNKLIWYLDAVSIPADTQSAINAILDPHRTYPGKGLPIAVNGHRYLITSDIGNQSNNVWGDLTANANDIIEFSSASNKWLSVFDSKEETDIHYMKNSKNNKQLKWENGSWIFNIDGEYHAGAWRLFL